MVLKGYISDFNILLVMFLSWFHSFTGAGRGRLSEHLMILLSSFQAGQQRITTINAAIMGGDEMAYNS